MPVAAEALPPASDFYFSPQRVRGPSYSPCYTSATYCHCLKDALRRAGLTLWCPNRLRHSFATMVRKEFGLEAAQVLLGHSRADVTQVYAARDSTLGAQVAAKIG